MSPDEAQRIASAIKAARFRYAGETRLQEGIAGVLAEAGIAAEREVPLNPRDKIDFLAGGTGIEVKIAGQPDDVTRQLRRYAGSDRVASLVLVTTRARHRSVPREIGGKPVHVVWLSGVTG